ncbi:MAG: hypothetical protein K8T91_11110 [Planctomycetes bacterium]|nr:hypothetical protein [Planctomycetota bacterium]
MDGSRDANLADIIEAWPTLPDTVKARIKGIVEGAAAAIEPLADAQPGC